MPSTTQIAPNLEEPDLVPPLVDEDGNWKRKCAAGSEVELEPSETASWALDAVNDLVLLRNTPWRSDFNAILKMPEATEGDSRDDGPFFPLDERFV
jgi:hypothetical protein